MNSKYWFVENIVGIYSICAGNEEIASTPSREVAIKVTEALNAHDDDEPKVFVIQNRVKEWRLRRDLTQAQLADLIGVHQGTIAKYETARVGLDLEALEKLANALQVKPSLLISNHGEQT